MFRHGCESRISRRRAHRAPHRTRRDSGPIVAVLVPPSGDVRASRCIHPGCAEGGPQAIAAVPISSMFPFVACRRPSSEAGSDPASLGDLRGYCDCDLDLFGLGFLAQRQPDRQHTGLVLSVDPASVDRRRERERPLLLRVGEDSPALRSPLILDGQRRNRASPVGHDDHRVRSDKRRAASAAL